MIDPRRNRVEEVLEQAERRRAEKIKTLRALLSDPELSGIIDELFSESVAPAVAPKASNGHQVAEVPSVLAAAIRALGPVLPHRFTVQDLAQALIQSGFVFKRDAISATRDAFYEMVKGGKSGFVTAEKGEPGKPNVYQYVKEI